ncbi:DUF3078 domain-containing protein [Dysgonomonas sp. Marseille-P4677]|uniref:DUF3078 domain-containing protein n=1 Tax=Dysgonomonas sp. Marseille-P4677 TaxID=2364790 RepID=UPI00191422EC|nr:DUF3078 domain-containing protein [Dysgonomonas sp. Marseille-P4677]MBK5722372.1 DUF3078 domain-containing protein [Dysgonomonas sp. Marseille-P4677]
MRIFLLTIIFVALAMGVQGQDEKDKLVDGKWTLKGVTGVNLSQTAVSNWSAGGENAMAGTAYLNGTLVRKSGNWLFSNALALEYGLTNTKTQGTQKTSDKIDFTTQLGYSTDNKWYYTVMGDFKSQFYKGYNYPDKEHYISNFFAPAYSNISIGMEYRPNTIYSVYLSPLAGKLTFVEDDYLSSIGAFGVDPGDRFKAEMGAYLKARMEKTIMENVKLISTLDLFTGYDDSFGNVDVNWDLLLSMKINKYLSASVNTTLKYDDDVKIAHEDGTIGGPKVQFKEMIGLGVAYNF